ncbi:Zn-dependent hydrolase [Marinobacterium mangrovicola]|uniref:N-carbamoyl-L-amino-acid hydrolase n=1 Tax=Marinobacterium mangrovicola TaxID=1476959 RepID=A0A4R1GD47_9GAMM|nr:Zn-dependent hydrolase [Marinobacterium mangrovicola]TCK04763.1 N-carbamoyl-L-amino-acid hydrolase [Marinobacterium mangrovicola]
MQGLNINAERLWQSLMAIGDIGHVDVPGSKVGGCHRLALSEKDLRGRQLFIDWCRAEGCSLRIDAIGNLFLRRPGRNNDLAPIVTGSHLDTQPTGGKFDGIFGCLAGLEAIRALNERGIETERPIEVVVWTNEEGARFKPAMLGSGVFAGVFTLEEALAKTDANGVTVADALLQAGYDTDNRTQTEIHRYFELHIEQGPVLEANNIDLGIVSGVLGMRWYRVHVSGQSCHAGPSPMEMRNDALVGSAKMISELTEMAAAGGPSTRCTIGELEIPSASCNVSPGEVIFSLDLREASQEALQALEDKARALIEALASARNLSVSIEQFWELPASPFDSGAIEQIRTAASEFMPAEQSMTLVSGAGHDAVYISRVAPTAMIFVPSENGLSHNEKEYTPPEQLAKGANLLLHTLLQAANS